MILQSCSVFLYKVTEIRQSERVLWGRKGCGIVGDLQKGFKTITIIYN
jgi:hypothetical protein